MAIELISKIKPKNGGTFPMVDAEDVLMPDGSRLSTFKPSGLPDVTGEDNGKFLLVWNGAWTPVAVADYIPTLLDYYIANTFISLTQAEYDALVAAGEVDANKYYMIVGDGE